MKKLLLISLMSLCAYAADDQNTKKEPFSPLEEYLTEWTLEDKFGGPINPSKFNDFGKKVLASYISVWIAAAEEGNIPQNQGLAKVFADMQKDGIEKVINDGTALKKANEYFTDYQTSPSAEIELILKYRLKPGKDGNYYFPGAVESNVDRVRITRQHEFYNIMYKRHETPKMPEGKLVGFYYDTTTASALESLKLNESNDSLKPAAIRGIALLSTYFYQNDQKDNEQQ